MITPTVPERILMLDELCATVDGQTFTDWEHLVLVDQEYRGCSATVNALVAEAAAPWLFLIADDDLLLPDCLALHMAAAGGADVVYSPPVVEGEPEAPFHGDPPGIPATALIKTALWREIGGYDLGLDQCEDLRFFEQALIAGAVFHRIREQTWVYRFHMDAPDRPGNKSRGKTFGR